MKNWSGLIITMIILSTFITCSSSTKKEEQEKKVEDMEGPYVTIKGFVKNPQQGQIVIQELKDGNNGWSDTIRLAGDKTFTKRVKVNEPGYYRLNFYNTQVVNLILYKNDLQVTVDGNSMTGTSEIKGSPEIDFVMKANSLVKDIESSPEVAQLNQEFEAAVKQQDQRKIEELQATYYKLLQNAQNKIVAMIKEQPVSLGVINFLQNQGLDQDQFFDTYFFVAERLKKEWANYTHAKNFIAMVDGMKATAIGQVAPEIALPNPEGAIVKLSSFRGNYVLIDFWAKWCGPCRKENPTVVKAYNKYKDKGFHVFGVSLDRTKEDWLQGIREDGLTWTHVSDLKYWQSEAARLYNVTGIPFSLLLDPEGKIIAKNLRGPALEAKLEEVLNKTK